MAAALDEARALADAKEGESDAACVERAAWIMMARVLLNLDEFITRE